ncbi:MAG: hypothetical protein K2N81_13115 [Acetatifactor sp.]|nr:hypothetical protein [Acetatifactor sp.]
MIEDSYFVIVVLFLTYLAMEALEHHTESKVRQWVQRAGRPGPLVAGCVGLVPNCATSVVITQLYLEVELKEKLQVSLVTVKRLMSNLQKRGVIERQGSNRKGKWVILERRE